MAGNKRLTDNNTKERAYKLFLGVWCLQKQGRGSYNELLDEQAERYAGSRELYVEL
jgi:hypothetical protein